MTNKSGEDINLEIDDIQGIIVRGYGYMPSARFVLFNIKEADTAKEWLSSLAEKVTASRVRPQDACINIAFTYDGLKALGVDDPLLTQFSREFQEGMTTPHRQRILGDNDKSSPDNWEWGGNKTHPVHVLLMLYAPDESALEELYQTHAKSPSGGGMEEVQRLDTLLLKGRKEHFGFRDGISQPTIAGKYTDSPVTDNTVAAGEFVFGYRDEYNEFTNSPGMSPDSPDHDAESLPEENEGIQENGDFGRNGSYLVFRQLSQDVPGFWRFLDEKTKETDGQPNPQRRVKLASKMVGRWPSGAPLVKAPDGDRPEMENDDDFGYHSMDPLGLKCPVGSHVRRTNPRDALLEDDPDGSVPISNRHRIIRRGRAYGTPLDDAMDPQNILDARDSGEDRGLQFICFNTNIGRQFEFIQHSWINNPKFQSLYDDADPLMGNHDRNGKGDTGSFIVPAEPVRQRITGLTRFVEVRGGAYFFMPGIRTIRYLANNG